MNVNKGFTLIEILVTMSLLSMIVLIGSSAIGLFGSRWDGRLGHFEDTMRNAQQVLLVQDVLKSLVPYVAYNRSGKPVIYFEGNRNGFVAVSSKSIYSDRDFAVVRFSVKQADDLTFDVLYEEAPMSANVLVSLNQTLSFTSPMVLFESVSNPHFQYFGWPNAEKREDESGLTTPARWLETYNGLDALFAPIKASLSFSTSEGNYQIYSLVASEPNGLLSRYARNPLHILTSPPELDTSIPEVELPQDDQCDC
ncbi:MAG: Uncharacterised protein [Porticoccaceae bacterium UBA1117]|nr:MAG: Uncharacterised protein [Porticoccaceae bacterium UBA1117]